ncbi:MAG: hypothetical protein LBJ23_10365 [Tannerella sp.]|nr:hypothetical protein [Tannerella sp.]
MKKRKQFVPYILLAVCMLCLSGCDNDVSDPSAAILGKWELKERAYPGGALQPFEPYEHIEFLSDGKVRTYDYESKEYQSGVASYWFEGISDFLIIGRLDYSDGTVQGSVYSYEFVSKNVLKLEVKQLLGIHDAMMRPEIYIYKRKK